MRDLRRKWKPRSVCAMPLSTRLAQLEIAAAASGVKSWDKTDCATVNLFGSAPTMLNRCLQIASRRIGPRVCSMHLQPVYAAQISRPISFLRMQSRALSTDESGPRLGERAKIATANALMKSLLSNTNGFDAAFNGLSIVRMGDGDIVCSLDVDKRLENPFNALHGGAICTLVDFAGTLSLMTQDPTRPGVSVDLSVSFMSSAKAGDTLDIRGKVLKMGKKLGFTEVEIYNKETGRLIASGRHTKYFS